MGGKCDIRDYNVEFYRRGVGPQIFENSDNSIIALITKQI